MMNTNAKRQTYNDGLVRFYGIPAGSGNGDMPDTEAALKCALRYEERTFGITRREAALQDNAEVKYLLRCPRRREVSAQDIAVPNDGRRYRVRNVQYPSEVTPPSMDVELVELVQDYISSE